MALVKQELHQINGKLSNISSDLEKKYAQSTELALVRIEMAEMRKASVTQDQFWPIRTLVYGAVGIMLITLVGAIVGLVILKVPT